MSLYFSFFECEHQCHHQGGCSGQCTLLNNKSVCNSANATVEYQVFTFDKRFILKKISKNAIPLNRQINILFSAIWLFRIII